MEDLKNELQFPHLERAPITEAIIDIKVELPADFQLSAFDAIIEANKSDYPIKKERLFVSGEFVLIPSESGTEPSPVKRELLGYWLYSADGKEIVQIRKDGFTFNRLSLYTSWDEIFVKAIKLWAMYVHAAGSGTVTRIAVRYINKLQLPVEGLVWQDYLKASPPRPPGLPNEIGRFFTNVWTIDSENDIIISITQTIDPDGNNSKSLAFILDIEVFKEFTRDLTDETIFPQFELMRIWKNKAFFGSLTQKAIDIYL